MYEPSASRFSIPEIPLQQTTKQLEQLESLLSDAPSPQLQAWHNQLRNIEARLRESIIRIAVVGVVKSGKSSLINALLQQDLLRRGAGILTSQITKIRTGSHLKAKITFKSSEELEHEFQTAFAFLNPLVEPSTDWDPSLFRAEDRQQIQSLLEKHPFKIAEREDHFVAEYSEIEALIHGFEEISSYLNAEPSPLTLQQNKVIEHQNFVANDHLAIYIRDILLEVPSWSHSSIELADCQGIDSPNPIHLTHVQEYLNQCTWVIYVISSRTGIRQSDIKLLKILEQFGLLKHTLFVINLDLNEHENKEDAFRVIEQIEKTLTHWIPFPQIFSFSVLFQLFSTTLDQCSKQDHAKFQLWKESSDLIPTHQANWMNFQELLHQQIEFQHVQMVQQSEYRHWEFLLHQILVFVSQLQQEATQESKSWQILQEEKKWLNHRLENAVQTLQSMFQGVQSQWKQEMVFQVNAWFDEYSEQSFRSLLEEFVDTLQLSAAQPEYASDLSIQVMLWYGEARQKLLTYVLEEINPALLQRLHTLSFQLTEKVNLICDDINALVTKAYQNQFNDAFNFPSTETEWKPLQVQFPELALISFSSSLSYQTPEKFKALYWFGKTLLVSLGKQQTVGRLFRERITEELKKELRSALEFDLLNYQENLKFRYLWHGVECMVEQASTSLQQLLESTIWEINQQRESLWQKQTQQEEWLPQLKELQQSLEATLSSSHKELQQSLEATLSSSHSESRFV